MNEELVVGLKDVERLVEAEIAKLDREKFPKVKGKVVVLVDDGIATGASLRVAIKALRDAKKVVVAVPVGAEQSIWKISKEVNELICLERPCEFYAVGQFYENCQQVSDAEAERLLRKS